MHRVKHRSLFAGLILLVSCSPLKPSQGPGTHHPPPATGVTITLDLSEAAALQAVATDICVRIMRVASDGSMTQEGTDKIYPFQTGGFEIELSEVTLGLKEFHVMARGSQGERLAEGSLQHKVVPGPQRVTSTLTLKLIQIGPRLRNADLMFTIAARYKGQPPVKTTYQDVKPFINRSCTGACHSVDFELDLRTFPFVPPMPKEQAEIVRSMIDRVEIPADGIGRMPRDFETQPAIPLTAGEINTLKKWLADGLPVSAGPSQPSSIVVTRIAVTAKDSSPGNTRDLGVGSVTGQPGVFRGTLIDAPVGGRYTFVVSVFGESDVALGVQSVETIVSESGALPLTVDLEVERPHITIPVTIEP